MFCVYGWLLQIIQLDISYSEEILKRSVDAYRRIRNTARFLLSNII